MRFGGRLEKRPFFPSPLSFSFSTPRRDDGCFLIFPPLSLPRHGGFKMRVLFPLSLFKGSWMIQFYLFATFLLSWRRKCFVKAPFPPPPLVREAGCSLSPPLLRIPTSDGGRHVKPLPLFSFFFLSRKKPFSPPFRLLWSIQSRQISICTSPPLGKK